MTIIMVCRISLGRTLSHLAIRQQYMRGVSVARLPEHTILGKTTSSLDQSTGVVNDKDQHGEKHQECIKHIDVYLLGVDIGFLASSKLNGSDQIAHHQRSTGNVDCPHVSLPGKIGVVIEDGSRPLLKTPMELGRNIDEERKDNQGEDQACQHDFLADLHDILVTRHLHACTSQLRAEAQDVVHDEDKSEPLDAHT